MLTEESCSKHDGSERKLFSSRAPNGNETTETSANDMNASKKSATRFVWVYKLLVPIGQAVNRVVDRTIKSTSTDATFFDLDDFPWVREVEAMYPEIRAEYIRLLDNPDQIPNTDSIGEGTAKLAKGPEWKAFVLMLFGCHAPHNSALCPKTAEALAKIPGVKSGLFSVLAPGAHLPNHCGDFAGILRYHLGIVIPKGDTCAIRVDDETRHWQEGKSLIFDDTHPHEAWNHSDESRVVLFVDFVRPMPWPFEVLTKLAIWLIGRTPYMKDVLRNAQLHTAARKH